MTIQFTNSLLFSKPKLYSLSLRRWKGEVICLVFILMWAIGDLQYAVFLIMSIRMERSAGYIDL